LAQVLDLQIKWPNDLIDQNGRKVAGILAELEASQGFVQWAIIGVGINVNQVEFPAEIPNPGSLAQLRGPQDRSEILRDSVFAIERWCAELSSGADSMLEAWRRRSAHLGKRVRVGEIEGVARDVREDGALLVETLAGVVPILAGDVEMMG
jgi:BirA family biotin operon repressor/biotin-[acetyl-CoA-carboxylase] ligase